LSSASQAIDGLQQLGELPPALAEPAPSLSSLEAFSKTDLLAAGKLAGDPQALLLQAERELGASLDQLSHLRHGNAAYLTPLLALRSTWASCPWPATNWSAAAARNWPPMSSAKSQHPRQAEQLDALPLLGVVASVNPAPMISPR
jgi:hypothetical protein